MGIRRLPSQSICDTGQIVVIPPGVALCQVHPVCEGRQPASRVVGVFFRLCQRILCTGEAVIFVVAVSINAAVRIGDKNTPAQLICMGYFCSDNVQNCSLIMRHEI